ncbi:hypothetical protein [Singulisphaera sp. PoT]|uniref:hypothetical protein n=1 Tax=Singulisphaera sp. PoT TaxID=3411797 RepID=UPI003BF53A8A
MRRRVITLSGPALARVRRVDVVIATARPARRRRPPRRRALLLVMAIVALRLWSWI